MAPPSHQVTKSQQGEFNGTQVAYDRSTQADHYQYAEKGMKKFLQLQRWLSFLSRASCEAKTRRRKLQIMHNHVTNKID